MIKDTSVQDKVVKPKLMNKVKLPALLATIGVLLSSLVWASYSQKDIHLSVDKSDLQTATIHRGTLTRDVVTNGKIVAANAPVLYASEFGVVTLLHQPGDKVKQGDVVASIDSPELSSNLMQQQALLDGLRNSLESALLDARREQLQANRNLDIVGVDLSAAKRESRRGDELIKHGLISRIDYEKSVDELNKAKLMYAHAEKETSLMKDTLSFGIKNKEHEVNRQALLVTELERQVAALKIKTPVGGIIGNWLTEQKARIHSGQAILTVVDLSAFEAELAVSESYAEELGLGMKVELRFGDRQIIGQISSISPEVRNREVSVRVRFKQNNHLTIRQNQRLSARILLENRPNVLMIKRGAFMGSGGSKLAYSITDDIARKKNIELGARSMNSIEVINGGKEGDVWVISSLAPFKNNEKVRVH